MINGGEFVPISVSLDVYRKLESERRSVEETHDTLLKRLLDRMVAPRNKTTEGRGLWHKGVQFPEGMKLRRLYKGNLIETEVRDKRLWMNGKSYLNPARAAVQITGHNVNAWRFWQYFDERKQSWEFIDRLRSGIA